MALTFIWGGLWIGYWIVDIGGWYVSVWTMCILSVGWTCCQPKRWLSSPCGGARAGGRPRRGSKSTWCLPPASISGLAPASSLGRSSPQPRPASTLYLLPGHRHLRLSSPHCHTSTLLFQILLWQWSHRTPRHCTLTSHPGCPQGMQLMNSIPWGTQPSTYRDQINYICQKNKSFHYAWMCR